MTFVALELPDHDDPTKRASGKLVDPTDPVQVASLIRQAAVDVLAAIHAISTCGLPKTEGQRLISRDLRYLGYSLGGITGAVVRSLGPKLGAMVLVAPGGDLSSWLVPQALSSLGLTGNCAGGANPGQPCTQHSACGEKGRCFPSHQALDLGNALRLPYRQLLSPGEPLSFAGERTGAANHSPLLIVTGGQDRVLPPLLASHLAEAQGLRRSGESTMRGPDAHLAQWSGQGHGLIGAAPVAAQSYTFLASRGRRLLPVQGAVKQGQEPNTQE